MCADQTQAVAIIDHQVGLFSFVRGFEPTYYREQMFNHARLAKAFNLPVVLTTSAQTGAWWTLSRSRWLILA
ncbi:hypothetical protein IMZ48_06845 [Candidatus Bathyarchaeota archaeon]|nr:hypothetical protein [Candidatus Bathyarchaeota archaeon]